jgi:hypothetical protein
VSFDNCAGRILEFTMRKRLSDANDGKNAIVETKRSRRKLSAVPVAVFPLEQVLPELLVEIFGFLSLGDIGRILNVNKRFFGLIAG